MSVLNLGLQLVGLARRQVEEEMESEIQRCTTMLQIRELALKKPSIKESLLDAVSPVNVNLADIAQRLELKGKKFSVEIAACTICKPPRLHVPADLCSKLQHFPDPTPGQDDHQRRM